MKKIFIGSISIIFLLGCATQEGYLSNARNYYEYDVNFDREKGFFTIPFGDAAITNSTVETK